MKDCGDESYEKNCEDDPDERRTEGDHSQTAQTDYGDPEENLSGPLNGKDEQEYNCGDDRRYQNLENDMSCVDNIRDFSPEMTIKALLNYQSGARERVVQDCGDENYKENCGDDPEGRRTDGD